MIPPDSRRAQDYGYKYGYSGEYKSAYGYSYNYSYGKNNEVLAYAPNDEVPQKIETVRILAQISGTLKRIIKK